MAEYSFERMSVLIAEGNASMRGLLQSAMLSLGVGHVTLVRNGREAVRRLRVGSAISPTAGPLVFDLVIAERRLLEIDGVTLLEWLRQNRDSRNRFTPMIMLSGSAREEDVAMARDAGVNEFLAKPITGPALVEHLFELIEQPRPFIYCASFFGPDRRRNIVGVDYDRRRMKESEIRIVHGERPPPPLTELGHAVWRFYLPNRLRGKVLQGDPSTPATIPSDLAEKTHRAIEQSSESHTDSVERKIKELYESLASCADRFGRADVALARMGEIAAELCEQGDAFGYPLMTHFAGLLTGYLNVMDHRQANQFALLKAHIDAMNAVIRQRIHGDGGEIGAALIDGLRAAKTRYEARGAGSHLEVRAA